MINLMRWPFRAHKVYMQSVIVDGRVNKTSIFKTKKELLVLTLLMFFFFIVTCVNCVYHVFMIITMELIHNTSHLIVRKLWTRKLTKEVLYQSYFNHVLSIDKYLFLFYFLNFFRLLLTSQRTSFERYGNISLSFLGSLVKLRQKYARTSALYVTSKQNIHVSVP